MCSLWETLFYLIFQSFPFGLKCILVIQQIEYLLYQAMKIQNWLIFKMCWILKQKEEQVLREIRPTPHPPPPDAFELRNSKTCMIGYVCDYPAGS